MKGIINIFIKAIFATLITGIPILNSTSAETAEAPLKVSEVNLRGDGVDVNFKYSKNAPVFISVPWANYSLASRNKDGKMGRVGFRQSISSPKVEVAEQGLRSLYLLRIPNKRSPFNFTMSFSMVEGGRGDAFEIDFDVKVGLLEAKGMLWNTLRYKAMGEGNFGSVELRSRKDFLSSLGKTVEKPDFVITALKYSDKILARVKYIGDEEVFIPVTNFFEKDTYDFIWLRRMGDSEGGRKLSTVMIGFFLKKGWYFETNVVPGSFEVNVRMQMEVPYFRLSELANGKLDPEVFRKANIVPSDLSKSKN